VIPIPGLAFEEEQHEYRWHGAILPSVTTVLKSAGIIDTTHFSEASRIRGQHVHEAAHYFDEGDLELESLRPEIQPYVAAYIKFRQESGFYPLLSEQRLHYRSAFAGTLDRVGWLNNRMVLFDIKTGGLPKWASLQTAAYDMALEEMIRLGEIQLDRFPEARFALQLSEDGRYKLWPLNGSRDRDYFLGALAVHQFKAE
jgi:hypothetical protein